MDAGWGHVQEKAIYRVCACCSHVCISQGEYQYGSNACWEYGSNVCWVEMCGSGRLKYIFQGYGIVVGGDGGHGSGSGSGSVR